MGIKLVREKFGRRWSTNNEFKIDTSEICNTQQMPSFAALKPVVHIVQTDVNFLTGCKQVTWFVTIHKRLYATSRTDQCSVGEVSIADR